jgi:hypothetical protein
MFCCKIPYDRHGVVRTRVIMNNDFGFKTCFLQEKALQSLLNKGSVVIGNAANTNQHGY